MYDDKVVLFVNDCTYDILLTKSFDDCMFIILLVLPCIVSFFHFSFHSFINPVDQDTMI
jgi:hypothetical protein